jgi:hypothetical protein
MKKKVIISEKKLVELISKMINEEVSEPKEEKKQRCLTTNSLPLDEIVGGVEGYSQYSPGVTKRQKGVSSLIDNLGILNNLRLFKDIKDGGSHLAYDTMNTLNGFRNKNYYDETSNECHRAMDKVVELYKENEHGTELVRDIERVLNLQPKEDEFTPSPRAKEYLKRCLILLKEK